jgi:hypothetical protein
MGGRERKGDCSVPFSLFESGCSNLDKNRIRREIDPDKRLTGTWPKLEKEGVR